MKKPLKKWSDFYLNKSKEDFPRWPIEHIVKIFFGDYLNKKINLNNNMVVLDVGCGFGNNLLPFLTKGLKCYGTEITEEIVSVTKNILSKQGYETIIKVGSNRHLPYADNTFDIVISSGVIHYEKQLRQIKEAIKEYSRVLKQNGILFISTTGPEHELFKKAKKIGLHRYQIRDFDFRNSEIFFFFENTAFLKSILKPFFQFVEIGRVTEKLMNNTIDTLIAVGQIKLTKKLFGNHCKQLHKSL